MFNKLPLYTNSVDKLANLLRKDLENKSTYAERYAVLNLLDSALDKLYDEVQPLATAEILGTPEYREAAAAGKTEVILHDAKFRISTRNEYPLDTLPEYAEKQKEVAELKATASVANKELSAIRDRLVNDLHLAPTSSKITLSFYPQDKPAK